MTGPRHWLLPLRSLWTAAFSLFFLLNLDQFGSEAGLGPAPKYWIVGAFLVTALLFLPGLKSIRLLRSPLAWWAVGYLLVSVLWIGPADNLEAAVDGLVMVGITCFFVAMALLAYPLMDVSGRLWAAVLWVSLLLAVASILHEYNDPSAYLFAEAGMGIAGRAAGVYLNPTIAAQALVMILACLLGRCSRRVGLLAVVVALIGLFPTFSRGGFVAWAALVAVATWRGRLPRWFLIVLVAATAILLLAGGWLLEHLSVWIAPENRNSLDRLSWALGQGSLDDNSAGERKFIAAFGWNQFLQAPFSGHGLGSMFVWVAGVGTHNMVLRNMVEYGILGALIFPLFLTASVRSATPVVDGAWLWSMAGIALLLSVFSHNMSEQPSFLLPWLAICLMPHEAVQARPRRVLL